MRPLATTKSSDVTCENEKLGNKINYILQPKYAPVFDNNDEGTHYEPVTITTDTNQVRRVL